MKRSDWLSNKEHPRPKAQVRAKEWLESIGPAVGNRPTANSTSQELIDYAQRLAQHDRAIAQARNRELIDAARRNPLPHDTPTATRSGEPIAPALQMIREGSYVDDTTPGPPRIPFMRRIAPWLFKGIK